MRLAALTTTILWACLALPASAAAVTGEYGDYPAPTGSICLDGVCFQLGQGEAVTESVTRSFTPTSPTYGIYHTSTGAYTEAADSCWYLYKSRELWQQAGSPVGSTTCVYVGSEVVARHYKRWLFNDIPEVDRDRIQAMQEAIYNEYRVGGQLMRTAMSVSPVRVQTVGTFCSFYAANMSLGGDYPAGVALDRTPNSIMQACSFTRRVSDPVPGTTTTTATAPQPFVAATSTRCRAVSGSGRLWAVRTLNARCGISQSIIAQYARTLRSPAGWRCTALVTDTSTKARCSRLTRAGATAYGIRVR